MTRAALALCALAACGGSTPVTRYYALAPATAPAPAAGSATAAPPARPAPTIAIEPLDADPPYDDDRIVYRADPYRVDYYEYHRWSASPGTMLADYLSRALERTGRFHAVLRDPSDAAPITLGGHLDAIEEIDASHDHWIGHISLDLTATDRASGVVVWSKHFDESEPLSAQSPEGLARALSKAMARVVAQVTPELARLAQARVTSPDATAQPVADQAANAINR